MPEPIIDTRTSILSIEEGGVFSYYPAAKNSPTSWAASGLPAGLSINTSTGAITGTLADSVTSTVYHVTLSATNADGTDEIILVIPVFKKIDVVTGEITIEINVDLITGKVTVVGMGEDEFSPPTKVQRETPLRRAVLLVKEGDRFPVSIGFTRDGVLQDLDLRTLRMKCKEFEPDGVLGLLESGFTKTDSGDKTRFDAVLNVKEATFAGVLSNYEEDTGTYADTLAEIEFSILASSNSYDTTKLAAITLTGGDTETNTLVFNDLPKVATSAEYAIDIDLTVTGLVSQSVSLSLTADIAYNGDTGLFEASNVTGTTSGSGAAATGTQWQATLEMLSLTGTADGFNVTVRTTTTSLGEGKVIVMPSSSWTIESGLIQFADPYTTSITYEVRATPIGGGAVSHQQSFSFSFSATETDVLNAITSNGTNHFADVVDEVVFDDANDAIVVIFNEAAAALTYSIEDFVGSAILTEQDLSGFNSKAGSYSVQFAGETIDDIYRKTSETFIIRVERDIIADL